jgi:hypothetical protein
MESILLKNPISEAEVQRLGIPRQSSSTITTPGGSAVANAAELLNTAR